MPLRLDDLRPNDGAHTFKRRVGRGHGSGRGKTAGRGTKGQKSRAGGGVRRGFEGGQNPIQQRMPYKRGFTNIWKTPWEVVNLSQLAGLEIDAITPEELYARGLIRGTEFPVKILGNGDFDRSIAIAAHAFSASARERITTAGGTIEELERTDRWVNARPRSRRLPFNRTLREARVGKSGGPERGRMHNNRPRTGLKEA